MTRRVASLGHCRKCGQPILSGLDDDICALDAHVDPDPVTPEGEFLGVLAGRLSYDGHRVTADGRIELRRRDLHHLPTRTTDIFVEHRCGQPLPVAARITTRPASPDLQSLQTSADHPPF